MTNSPITTAPTAMSSREIADLTGKEHRHVCRDIRKMLTDVGIEAEGYAQDWTDPQNGQSYREFRLPKDLTLTLVAGYRSDMRLKIVRRWLELEEGGRVTQTPPKPKRLRSDFDVVFRRFLDTAKLTPGLTEKEYMGRASRATKLLTGVDPLDALGIDTSSARSLVASEAPEAPIEAPKTFTRRVPHKRVNGRLVCRTERVEIIEEESL